QGKLPPDRAAMPSVLEQRLAVCKQAGRAIADLSYAAAQPMPLARQLLLLRARSFAAQGIHAAAAEAGQKLAALDPAKAGDLLLDVACGYAICVQGVSPAKTLDRLTPEEKQTRAGYAKLAVEALQEAVDHGYNQPARLRTERHLDAIRNEPG